MSNSTDIFSPLHPEWIQFGEWEEYPDSFWEIVNFFLMHSICDNQSWKGCTLEKYNWKRDPWTTQEYLKDKLLNAIWGKETHQLFAAEKKTQYKDKLYGKALDDDFYLNPTRQRMCFVKFSGKDGSEFMSLFRHIRNGLAHGRYGAVDLRNGDYMLFLEDGKPKDKKFEVTARIVIKGSSLLRIIDIIQGGPDPERDYAKEIVESIRRGNNTKTKIMEDLGITELAWKRESQRLKLNGVIIHKNNKWQEDLPLHQ